MHLFISEMDTLTEQEIENECTRQDNINDSDEEIALVKKMIEESKEDIKKLERQQFIEADELCDRQQKELDDLLEEHQRIKEKLQEEHKRQMDNSMEYLRDHEEHLAVVEEEKKALTDDPLIVPEDFDLYHN